MKITVLFLGLLLTTITFGQKKLAVYNSDSIAVTEYLGEKKSDTLKYSADVLTVLFANTFNSGLLGSNDISVSKYYATLTNEDNKFAFGYNFNARNSTISKSTWLVSVGASLKSKNGFATIFKGSKIQNDMNLNGKITRLGNGIITFSQNDMKSDTALFNQVLYKKYNDEFNEYVKDGGALEKEVFKLGLLDQDTCSCQIESLIKKKSLKIREARAKEEVESLTKYRLYKRLWNHAWVLSLDVPISNTGYKTADSITSLKVLDHKQYPWVASVQWTSIWHWRNQSKFFMTYRAKVYNNNNVERDVISSSDFLTVVNQSSTAQAVTETNKVYIGEFEKFVTPSFAAEFLFYPGKSWIGISASLEQSFLDYYSTDWKLGVPIVMKDKEGKPTVNLELQWKEVNKTHFLGFRFGFVLGKFVK